MGPCGAIAVLPAREHLPPAAFPARQKPSKMSKNFCTKGIAFRKVAHTMMPALVSRFDVGLFEL